MAEKSKKKAVPAAKKPEPAKKEPAKKEAEKDSYAGEIVTIAFGVLGIFIMISLWFSAGGIFGNWLNALLTGLFGFGAYLVPVALIGSAVCHFAFRGAAFLRRFLRTSPLVF